MTAGVLTRLEIALAAEDEARDDHGRWTAGGGGSDLPDDVFAPSGASPAYFDRVTDPDQLRNLPADVRAAARQYTEQAYEAVNGDLRETLRPNEYSRRAIPLLDEATRECELREGAVVYRGFSGAPEHLEGLTLGAVFTDPGFVSTSLSSDVARGFMRSYDYEDGDTPVLLAAHLPAGTQGFPGAEHESEWVLPRGARFEVNQVDVGSDGTHYVRATYLPPR